MLRDIEYHKFFGLLLKVSEMPKANPEIIRTLQFTDDCLAVDQKSKTILARALSDSLLANEFYDPDTIKNSAISLDLLFLLRCHFILANSIEKCENYKEVLAVAEADSFYSLLKNYQDKFEFCALAYVLKKATIPWSGFTVGFDGTDWSDIHLLSSVLPFSNASFNDFLSWITLIAKGQENDLALGSVGKYVYQWVLFKADKGNDIEANLVAVANHPQAHRFLSGILKGLKEIQGKSLKYYTDIFLPFLNNSNAYSILYGLGSIEQENDSSGEAFFKLIEDRVATGDLYLKDFIRLCCYYNYYTQEVYNRIDTIIETTQEKDELLAIIEFLQQASDDSNREWFFKAARSTITKDDPSLIQSLNNLLIRITESDLLLAYELFTLRLEAIGAHNLLKTALQEMTRENPEQFQFCFVRWLLKGNNRVHAALLHISSLSFFGSSMFEISNHIYDSLNPKEKLFVAYKIIGYVYSMKALQMMILSLIKSVKEDNGTLKEGLTFILQEYLVYNYRGTLKLINNDLSNATLLPFAKEIFQKTNDHFEDYFAKLNSISLDKELLPYRENVQLRNFYYRKIFADLPNNSEENSISSLFKSTRVNANNWAIRRTKELKHQPSPLGYISVTSEYPSGEKLNPINQEYIRRTYQKLEIDEINID
ncbi:hypothetical protein ACFSQD_11655 [Flavihumibacter stibioxidans]|uniref:Uncharacterized protein n=1 Tax=Flavihumibacter stibioxidans TaxID=1834163 RepID=A0ABR7M9K3_9BACT|nr:hypothetical protein [Flavihumibacter stibioxidans]MBC6491718.1 hypothetical protein [Flavihumibacter stibioxidans]